MSTLPMMVHDMEVREEGRAEGRAEGHAEGRAEGIKEAMLESIRNVMDTFHVTEQQAMEGLKIPLADRSKYSAMLKS